MGGSEGKALFIDSEGTFQLAIADSYGLNGLDVLDS